MPKIKLIYDEKVRRWVGKGGFSICIYLYKYLYIYFKNHPPLDLLHKNAAKLVPVGWDDIFSIINHILMGSENGGKLGV